MKSPAQIAFAFIGANGAGKSSSAQLIASLVSGSAADVETPSFSAVFRQAFTEWIRSAGVSVEQSFFATEHPHKDEPIVAINTFVLPDGMTEDDPLQPAKLPVSYRSYMSLLDELLLAHVPVGEFLFEAHMDYTRQKRGFTTDPQYLFVDDARKPSHFEMLANLANKVVTIAVVREGETVPDGHFDHFVTNRQDDPDYLQAQLQEILVSYGIPVIEDKRRGDETRDSADIADTSSAS